MPENHTWVQDTEVSGINRDKVYKSKSMMGIMFGLNSVIDKTQKFEKLGWREFEYFCSQWLKDNGYEVANRTYFGTDGGIDILAVRDEEILVADCNHWRIPVRPKEIRALHGVKARESAHRAVLMVLGKFLIRQKRKPRNYP